MSKKNILIINITSVVFGTLSWLILKASLLFMKLSALFEKWYWKFYFFSEDVKSFGTIIACKLIRKK